MTDSVSKAILKYSKKQLPKTKRATKNKKPEARVESAILKALKSHGFCVQKVESKATYSASKGAYFNQSAKSGTSDIVGCAPNGLGVFIEVKAPGKLKTLKPHQAIYLMERARTGAFACCSDSVDHVLELFDKWLALRKSSVKDAYRFLLEQVPIKLDHELFASKYKA